MRRARGEGTIFQRGKRWVAEVTVGRDAHGKRVKVTTYHDTQAEARNEARRLAEQRSLPGPITTVRSCVEMWLAEVRKKNAPATWESYSDFAGRFILPTLGHRRLADLTPVDVLTWQNNLPCPPASKLQAAQVLRRALRFAVRMQLAAKCAADHVPLPVVERQRICPLDRQQVARFLGEARKGHLYELFLFLIDTGCRIGEALALTWKDVDFDRGWVVISKSLVRLRRGVSLRPPKTRSSTRLVKLTPQTRAALEGLLARAKPNPSAPVFAGRRGTAWARDHVDNVLKGTLRRAGLPVIRVHDLRHTSATLLLEANVHAKVVSERLGHGRIQVTLDTYSHVLPSMQKGAAEKLAELLPDQPHVVDCNGTVEKR